jgi:hypothetical protein
MNDFFYVPDIPTPLKPFFFIEEYPLLIVKINTPPGVPVWPKTAPGIAKESNLYFGKAASDFVGIGPVEEYGNILLMSSVMYYDNFNTLRNIFDSVCQDSNTDSDYVFMETGYTQPIFTFSTEEWPSLVSKLDCAFGKTPVMILAPGDYNIHDVLKEKLYGL